MDDMEKVNGGFDWTQALELDKPVTCEYCGKTYKNHIEYSSQDRCALIEVLKKSANS